MLKFPRDLYSDVRVEDVAETTLVLEDGEAEAVHREPPPRRIRARL